MRTFNKYLPNLGVTDSEVATLKNCTSEIQSQINLKANLVGGKVPANEVPAYVEVTHSQLASLITASQLIVGQSYIITDYASVHTIPNTTTTNIPTAEPLIVLAIAANKLAPEAFSPSFPQDVIYYNPTNSSSMIPGCTKGYIYRRVDTQKNIDIGFDWRNVKFRRWQMSVTVEDATGAIANYTKGNVVKKTGTAEIYIKLNDATAQLFTNASSWKRYEFDDLQYISPVSSNWTIINNPYTVAIHCSSLFMDYTLFTTAPTAAGVQSSYTNIYDITISQNPSALLVSSNGLIFGPDCNSFKIGSKCRNFTIGVSCNNFTLGADSYNFSIGAGSTSITIKPGCYNFTVGAYCYKFTIEPGCNNFTMGGYCYSFTIGSGCRSFLMGSGCHSFMIEPNCNNFTIGANSYNFTIGANSYSFTMGGSCTNFTIGSGCNNFIVSDNFKQNHIPDNFCFTSYDFSAATLVYADYPKWFFKTPDGTIKLYYFANTTFAITVADVIA